MPKKILVVEDDIDMVDLLRFNLKKEGFALGTAADGIEALKKARSIRPDLILLDLMLPELDGFAVCEILRRDPKTASIPIIILTAMSSQLSRFSGLDAGANAYITKPFSQKYLQQCIQELLQRVPGTVYNPDHETNQKQQGGQAPTPATFTGETTESLA
jgi:DNA-binding response OmpR family regulator